MEQKNQITEGVIWKQLLIFFFPIVIGTFFQQVYNTADSIVVGRFVGKEALADGKWISESDRYTDRGSFCRTDFRCFRDHCTVLWGKRS